MEYRTIGVIGVESIKGTCYLQAPTIGIEDRNKDHIGMEYRTIGVIGVESIKGACYLHTLTIGMEDRNKDYISVEDRNKDHHRHGRQDNRCHRR